MMTFRKLDQSSCGIVEIEKESIVIDFHEKGKKQKRNKKEEGHKIKR